MRRSVFQLLAAGAVGVLLTLSSGLAFAKTAAECNAEYAANKVAIRAGGQTKRAFVAACRSGTETIPAATTAPATPAAPPPYQPPPAAAPAPAAPAPHVGAIGGGGFMTDAQARTRCPTDTVVWVNTKSHVYHFAGTRSYGNTKQGTYMCEADAKGAGDRAAKNEKHP
jgi:hypothetical protein